MVLEAISAKGCAEATSAVTRDGNARILNMVVASDIFSSFTRTGLIDDFDAVQRRTRCSPRRLSMSASALSLVVVDSWPFLFFLENCVVL